MNNVFTVLTGLSMNAYEIGAFLNIISIPAIMILRALNKKSPI